ncbi:hypothetical protein DJ90_6398 [Paenibacillus macerans]|uniref:Uncharacterized protein n=1 Tax=Paenibacillus macerans TaxID=44252 RepID=A0A091A590_PAEMA|nr:hypothetical protein DJ90_6398 [Paenibacillus macerans]
MRRCLITSAMQKVIQVKGEGERILTSRSTSSGTYGAMSCSSSEAVTG